MSTIFVVYAKYDDGDGYQFSRGILAMKAEPDAAALVDRCEKQAHELAEEKWRAEYYKREQKDLPMADAGAKTSSVYDLQHTRYHYFEVEQEEVK